MINQLLRGSFRWVRMACVVACFLTGGAWAQDVRVVQPCDARPPMEIQGYIDRQLELLKLETPANVFMILVTPMKGFSPVGRTEYGVALRTTDEGPKIVAVRARENIWDANHPVRGWSQVAIPVSVDQWEAPIDETGFTEIWNAFQRQARQMTFQKDRAPSPAESWDYHFYVILLGFDFTCGEIKVFLDERNNYLPTRLAETMIEYAKSPKESRSAIRGQLLKLASEMP